MARTSGSFEQYQSKLILKTLATGASTYPTRVTSWPCTHVNPRVQIVLAQVRNGVPHHVPKHLHQISLFTTRLHPRFTKLISFFSPIFDSSSTLPTFTFLFIKCNTLYHIRSYSFSLLRFRSAKNVKMEKNVARVAPMTKPTENVRPVSGSLIPTRRRRKPGAAPPPVAQPIPEVRVHFSANFSFGDLSFLPI